MKHFAAPSFWTAYNKLPQRVRDLADKNYALLRQNADHPSLHFKRLGRHWTVRVGLHYRAIGSEDDGTVVWFWIGSHADYDKLLGLKPNKSVAG
jgi:hypothetical protein